MDGFGTQGDGRVGEPAAHEPGGDRTEVPSAGPAPLGPVVDTPTFDTTTGAAALRSRVASGVPLTPDERSAALRIGLPVPLEPGAPIIGQACPACGGRFGVGEGVVYAREVAEETGSVTGGLAIVHEIDTKPGRGWRSVAPADRDEEVAAAGPEVLPAGTEPEVLLPATEWEDKTGIQIVNAHGWSHPWPNADPFKPGLEPRPYEDAISEDEFLARATHCTLADVNKLIEYAHGIPAPVTGTETLLRQENNRIPDPPVVTQITGAEHRDHGDETDHKPELGGASVRIPLGGKPVDDVARHPDAAEFYTTAELDAYIANPDWKVVDLAKLARTAREALHERDAAVAEYLEHHSPIFQSLVELAMVAGLAELDRQDKLVLRASANDVITLVIARGPHAGALAAWADDIITKGTN